MFYFDENMQKMQDNNEYVEIVKYLEGLYEKDKNADLVCSILGYSWFAYVRGDSLDPNMTEEDLEFFLSMWRKYYGIAFIMYGDDDFTNFILGYSYYLHGFHLQTCDDNEVVGLYFLRKSNELAKTLEMQDISTILLSRWTMKYMHNIYGPSKLFPSNCLLDQYFRKEFFL